MNKLTPPSIRESVVSTAHDRVNRLDALVNTGGTWDTGLKLATTILVAEILRDVDTLVTDSLFRPRKQKLQRTLSRVAVSKEGTKIALVIAAFARDARRILPSARTFDPENPPW